MNDALETFAAALGAVEGELDWAEIGRTYCEGDGSDFFERGLRERVRDTALLFADDLANALGGSHGASLYIGAAVAELPLILADHLVLGRAISWVNLDSIETRELARAIELVGERMHLALPRPHASYLASLTPASFDHIWLVSVLTDPDHFPALHDELYERTGTHEATGRGSLDDERRRAGELIDRALDCAASPCVLSTTEEELTLICPRLAQLGWSLALSPGRRKTAIVGDRVCTGRLTR